MLRDYGRPRPIEWLLSGMLLFAAGAAALGALAVWAVPEADMEGFARFQLLAAAGLAAVSLAYVGLTGKTWFLWARDEFVQTRGATRPEAGKVWVNIELEAQHDARIVRRAAWPLYIVGSAPLMLSAFLCMWGTPLPAMASLLIIFAGAPIVLVLVTSFPQTEEEKDW